MKEQIADCHTAVKQLNWGEGVINIMLTIRIFRINFGERDFVIFFDRNTRVLSALFFHLP